MTPTETMPFPELLRRFREDPLALAGRIPGVWPFHKPSGPTSHDCVARARRAWKLRRVGHAGTLDPLASGVLVLLADNATRLFDEFQEFSKTYLATLQWGLRTDTRDRTGQPLADWRPTRPSAPDRAEIENALAAFRGDILQTPPMYSALKLGGRPLYELARRGVEVERAGRPVTVHDLALVAGGDGSASARLRLTVSSGFYVRTLVDDLGLALGCGATMTELEREAVGPFTLADTLPLDGTQASGSRP